MPTQLGKNKHVYLGMSGGVDSAVAALMLLEQGYRVTSVFMKNWEEDDRDEYCAAAEDYAMVDKVCGLLEIPLKTVNFATEYWDRVFSYFLKEFQAGRTPNPDVLCNQEIKFKAFLEYAMTHGADYIATGHYARIQQQQGRYCLLQGIDDNKDQSYFLYTLGQRELSHTLFPVGKLTKSEVRTRARTAGLPNHDRKDSTGICFIGERDFKVFLNRYLPAQPGVIKTLAGEPKGRHDGLMFYTIGQRHGLGIGGPGEPWYVVDKNLASNILYVEQGENHPALYSNGLLASILHWVEGASPSMPATYQIRTRHRQTLQKGTLRKVGSDLVQAEFHESQRAITPGQSAVFYDKSICLGGGIIQQALGTIDVTFSAQAK